MTRRFFMLAVILAGQLTTPIACGQAPAPAPTPAPAANPMGPAKWRQDLQTLAKQLASKHKDAFTRVSREQFDAAVSDLDSRIDALTDIQVFYELKRIVAMVGDAHTQLGDGKGRFASPFLPISVLVLGDGVFVTAATPEHRDLCGLRVVRIGDIGIDEAINRLGALVPHENRAWLLGQVNYLILTPPALALVGLAPSAERVTFTLADSSGQERSVVFEPMKPGQRQTAAPGLEQSALALTMRGRPFNVIYGSMLLPDSRDLYVWYDSCRDMEGKSVSQFARETLDLIEKEKPERVIVDLRRNSGGNSGLIQPLINGLASRPEFKEPGRLFVLIGRGTFSSGLWAAQDFRKKTTAILVGGPTGGKPNSFGEQRSLELPNSGLTLFYSTKKWKRDSDADPDSLEPDVLTEAIWADLTGGKDTVLESARAFKPAE